MILFNLPRSIVLCPSMFTRAARVKVCHVLSRHDLPVANGSTSFLVLIDHFPHGDVRF